MFLVGDQPFLDSVTINTLIDQSTKNPQQIIVPVYNGKRGNPVIFPSLFRDDLLAIEGDIGGRAVMEKMEERVKLVPLENSIAHIDIDTQEDYERIKSQ
jgi:molybdenum cofactor cytidylyltransferase